MSGQGEWAAWRMSNHAPAVAGETGRAGRGLTPSVGWVSRDPITGQPATVHDIGTITLLDDETVGGFERARGAAPRKPDAPRAEEAIRRVRDAW